MTETALQTDDLALMTRRVALLDPTATPFPDVINTLGLLAELERRIKELKREIKACGVEQLKVIGMQQIGAMKYWAGAELDYKPINVRMVVEAMLNACCGDVDQFTELLTSDPFKPATCRKLLEKNPDGPKFDTLFRRIEKWDIANGVKGPKLIAMNMDFVK